MEVFILSHGYDYGDIFDKYKWNEESRVLGVYYTKREALKALSKYQKIKGFSSHLDGFWLEKYELDKDLGWEGGYTTYFKLYDEIEEKPKSKEKTLYLLSHFFYIGYEKKEKHRILSVCLSKSEAKKKIKQYQKIKGFSSHISNFYVEKYILDEIEN